MPRLGVNIDHVATLRQARGGQEPDPVWAAALAELGGADGITIHLREDRRHIQDRDLRLLRQTVQVRLNLELAADSAIIDLALELRPEQVTLVPERREELTTEGGLDVVSQRQRITEAVNRCRHAGLEIALFLDPEPAQIEAALHLNVDAIELHTGRYANSHEGPPQRMELEALQVAAEAIVTAGVELHAGHGLNYRNVPPVARLDRMAELNIGHSIISRALFVGLERAVREMKNCIDDRTPRCDRSTRGRVLVLAGRWFSRLLAELHRGSDPSGCHAHVFVSMECPGLPESLGHAHEDVSMAPKSLAHHHLRFISWSRGGDQRGVSFFASFRCAWI